MNKLTIYFENGVWKGFEAPEKPDYQNCETRLSDACDVRFSCCKSEYNQAYAAAHADALPILNAEMIQGGEEVIDGEWQCEVQSKDYVWPGTWEVKMDVKQMSIGQIGVPIGIVLSLPAKETGKTAVDFWYKSDSETANNDEQITLTAQRYSDQQLAAFKEKLKEELKRKILEAEGWEYSFERGMNEAIDLIDQL